MLELKELLRLLWLSLRSKAALNAYARLVEEAQSQDLRIMKHIKKGIEAENPKRLRRHVEKAIEHLDHKDKALREARIALPVVYSRITKYEEAYESSQQKKKGRTQNKYSPGQVQESTEDQ